MTTNVSKQGRKRSSARATHPIAKRLEQVRKRYGIRSIRAFWQKLVEEGGVDVTYAGARFYHTSREAPVSYLEGVTKAFPEVRMDWLTTGRGEMTEAEEEAARRSYEWDTAEWLPREPMQLLKEGFPELDSASTPVAHLVFSLATDIVLRQAAHEGVDDVGESFITKTGRLIRGWVYAPFSNAYFSMPHPDIRDPAFERYAVAALHALSLAVDIGTTTEE